MSDRGVSEVIAFVLVFSIVITSVGLLYTAGFGSITDIQEAETDRSAQRAFSAAAIALEDVQTGDAKRRAVDLELSGRTMAFNDSATISVEINDNPATSASGALVYGIGSDTSIVYQSGAVLLDQGPDAQIVTREPLFRCNPGESAMVSLVELNGSERAVSSDGSVQVVASGPDPTHSSLAGRATTGSTNRINVSVGGSNYATAWGDYLQEHGWTSTTTADQYSCSAEDVYARSVPIDLEYQGI